VSYKRYQAVYKRGTINIQINYCDVMKNPALSNPAFQIFDDIVKNYTPNAHPCPFKVDCLIVVCFNLAFSIIFRPTRK
jgi:hypothetical protein